MCFLNNFNKIYFYLCFQLSMKFTFFKTKEKCEASPGRLGYVVLLFSVIVIWSIFIDTMTIMKALTFTFNAFN